MKAIAIAYFLCLVRLLAYEVQITDSPRIDALPDNRVFAAPTEGKTTLLEFLGGKEKIKKIVIGIIANRKHGELNESVVQTRFADSVCMDSHKHEWHYAPFAMGTVYFVGGGRQSFSLHLSGVSIAGHLFDLSQKAKAESDPGE